MYYWETPIKHPRPPREFYLGFWAFLLGRKSPSLTMMVHNSPAAKKYYAKCKIWEIKCLEWLIENRKADKEQYRRYKHLIKVGVKKP